jgi:hypothetical protein
MEFRQDDATTLKRSDANPEECATGSPSSRTNKSPVSIDEDGIRELIEFFTILDKWDREARNHEEL